MIWLYYTIKTFLVKYWYYVLLAVLTACFIVATSAFNYLSQSKDFVKWSSPDETANYFLTKLYAKERDLSYLEPYNLVSAGIIMPRSFRTDGALVKPVSFLGIILIYGEVARLLGIGIIPFLTPIFAGIGIIFFFLIIRKLFDQRTALLSAFLLSAFPVYIYFSSRSMFHNILFVVMWLIGLYYSLKMTEGASFWQAKADAVHRQSFYLSLVYAGLAGFFIGLAVITRSSELIWIGPMFFVMWLANIRRVGLIKPIVAVALFALACLPVFYWNTVLYSAPIESGYPQLTESITTIASSTSELVTSNVVATSQSQTTILLEKLKKSIFVFGFDAEHSHRMFWNYVVMMFPWLIVLGIAGFWLKVFSFRTFRKKHLVYIISYLILSGILVYYYGSWVFFDNPDPKSFTIGNSYTRYWLPIYLGAIPFVAYAVGAVSKLFIYQPLVLGVRMLVIGLMMLSSMIFVMFGSDEGLVPTLARQQNSQEEFREVLSLSSEDSIIITRYHDKLFFPERKVIVGLFNDDNMNLIYSDLARRSSVYYYNFTFPEADFKFLNKSKLARVGLKIELIKEIKPGLSLYQLTRVD